MRQKIHPKLYDVKITCGCGNAIETRSTKKEIKVEVCSKCHPFYTGKQKLVDTAGRVEKFQRRYGNYMKNRKPAETEAPAAASTEAPKAETAPAEAAPAEAPKADAEKAEPAS